jgi:hypothetical protein
LKEKVAKIQEKTSAAQEIVKKMRSDEFVKAANGNGKKPAEEESDEPKEQRSDPHSDPPRAEPE